MFKTLKTINAIAGVLFTAAVIITHFDLDDKLMEKAQPLLIKMAQKKAAKNAQA